MTPQTMAENVAICPSLGSRVPYMVGSWAVSPSPASTPNSRPLRALKGSSIPNSKSLGARDCRQFIGTYEQ